MKKINSLSSFIVCLETRRTNNEIKNFWNTHIKRKLLNHGLDPQTHHPSTKFITIIFSTNILLIIMKK
ncbi:hypothetical protein CUMW_282730 [Citrus unshiu]|uniref:HTH myb-type domain-containing protein n=1 Tax=Citrus unshiu TaxID=55188 RepID=A0A2H5N3F5_CITUN|nr:hypothetical protein CUMW_282730 [Citrus unshiu]